MQSRSRSTVSSQGTQDRILGRAAIATTSPLLEQAFMRMAGQSLMLEPIRTPDAVKACAPNVDIFLIQEDIAEGGGLGSFLAAIRASEARSVPVIVFSRDPRAESRVLAQGASGFLTVPCLTETFWSLIRTWHRMHRRPQRVDTDATDVTAASPPKTATILLVDDSSVIHSFVADALQGTGYALIHAYDGIEGLDAARRSVPDLVISDIDMPNMDGYEMCRRLREEPATETTPIVILSARGKGVDIERSFDVGANDFLAKPVSENEFLSRIEQILSSSSNRQQRRERVLVVDDVAAHRAVIVHALVQQGFEVLSACDGLEALAIADRTPLDLVITDSEMPEMNGRELTRELKARERCNDVPVIMLTAADSPLNRLKSKHAGIAAYLTKPFVADKVVVIAEKLIAERRLLRERDAMRHYLSDSAIKAAVAAAAGEGAVGSEMRCETRFVTVLFADIVGFMSLTERILPEDLVALLNEYFDAMVPIIKDHHGVIDKLIGDGIMAVLGADGDRSAADSAASAVQAALAMQAALQRFNQQRPDPIQIRVGIHSGTVIMGDIGSRAHRRDYTVIGDSVNTAARLQASGKAGDVVISQSTYELLRGRFAVEPLGPTKLKGKSAPIEMYLVKAASAPSGE